MMTPDETGRQYAVSLLNRADAAFEARDVALLARVIPLIEADTASLLNQYAETVDRFHSVGGGVIRQARDLLAKGMHRAVAPAAGCAVAALEGEVQ